MALSYSTDKVDESGKEMLTYGTSDFPIAFFDDDLTFVKVPWHWHDELEFVLILSGKVTVYIAGNEFKLKKGEGYFANSGILHSATLRSKDGRQHAMVFDPKVMAAPGDIVWNTYISPILNDDKIPFIKLTPKVNWQKEVLERVEKAWRSGAYEKKDYPLTVRNSLSEAFRLLVNNIDEEHEYEYTSKAQREELRIKKTLNYIETHFREPITIEDIAKSGNISVSTLLRLYHDILRTTPIRYVIRYRLEQIADEIKQNRDIPISEAAYSGGFSDISYFNRCFLKEYGMTPTKFRSEA